MKLRAAIRGYPPDKKWNAENALKLKVRSEKAIRRTLQKPIIVRVIPGPLHLYLKSNTMTTGNKEKSIR